MLSFLKEYTAWITFLSGQSRHRTEDYRLGSDKSFH